MESAARVLLRWADIAADAEAPKDHLRDATFTVADLDEPPPPIKDGQCRIEKDGTIHMKVGGAELFAVKRFSDKRKKNAKPWKLCLASLSRRSQPLPGWAWKMSFINYSITSPMLIVKTPKLMQLPGYSSHEPKTEAQCRQAYCRQDWIDAIG